MFAETLLETARFAKPQTDPVGSPNQYLKFAAKPDPTWTFFGTDQLASKSKHPFLRFDRPQFGSCSPGFATTASCAQLPLKSDQTASAANGRKVRMAVLGTDRSEWPLLLVRTEEKLEKKSLTHSIWGYQWG